MRRLWAFASLAVLLSAACAPNVVTVTVTPGPPPTEVGLAPTETATLVPPTGTSIPPTNTLAPTAAPTAAGQPVAALPIVQGEFFATSGQCAVCHINMLDESGADVSLDRQWRSTMMANAGRDPYWQAGVRSEVLSNPDYGDFIQDKCATCHMPMARFTEHVYDRQGQVFDDGGFLDPENDLHLLAIDGVSCSPCHAIEASNFGERESFSGGYDIDPTIPTGQRPAYGPFPIAETQALIMQGTSGFIPTESEHVQQSELCGTCHTLYTPTLNAQGEVVGEFAEQMVYPEWLHSDYRESDSCVDCHLPAAEGSVVMSITGGEPRSPFMQHVFVGGNTYLPLIFRQFGDELQVTAAGEHFDATIAAVIDLLQNQTATVAIDAVQRDGAQLVVDVALASQTGHKFPSGYPARRTWLHVTVRDADGQVVFESGGFNADGSIVGNDNDADAARYEPHYQVIASADQVQIYEAVMQDVEGMPTTTLLSGAGYLKDNRLLPLGFDKATASEDIAVYGAAADDPDFVGGTDRIRYDVELGAASGPFTVEVALLYQPIGYRWAMNLRRHDTFEAARFLRYYEAVPNVPTVVASAMVEVE